MIELLTEKQVITYVAMEGADAGTILAEGGEAAFVPERRAFTAQDLRQIVNKLEELNNE